MDLEFRSLADLVKVARLSFTYSKIPCLAIHSWFESAWESL